MNILTWLLGASISNEFRKTVQKVDHQVIFEVFPSPLSAFQIFMHPHFSTFQVFMHPHFSTFPILSRTRRPLISSHIQNPFFATPFRALNDRLLFYSQPL